MAKKNNRSRKARQRDTPRPPAPAPRPRDPVVVLRSVLIFFGVFCALASIPVVAVGFSLWNSNIIFIKGSWWAWLILPAAAALATAHALRPLPHWRLPRSVLIALCLFLGVYVLSALVNPDYPGPLLKHLLKTGCAVAAFFVFALLAREPRALGLVAALITFSLTLVSLYGILQEFRIDPVPWQHDFDWGMPLLKRVTSTFGNPTYLAGFLVLTLPVPLCTAAALRRPHWRWLAAGCWLTGLLCLIFTFSRGGAIGLVVGLAVLAVGCSRLLRRDAPGWRALWAIWPRMWLVLALLCLLVLTVFAVWKGEVLLYVLGRLYDKSAMGRLLIYQSTLQMIADRPLLGFGPGSFQVYFPDYWSAALSAIEPRHLRRVVHAHSEYLQTAAELGVLGLLTWLGLLGSLLVLGFRALRTTTVNLAWWVRLAILAGACGALVESLFSVTLRYAGPIAIFWSLLGVLAGTLPVSFRPQPRTAAASTGRWATAIVVLLLTGAGLFASALWFYGDVCLQAATRALINQNPQHTGYARKALLYDPWKTQALYQIATQQFANEQFQDSIATCERILATERYYADLATLLGSACIRAGEYERAIELFTQATAQEPQYTTGHHYLGVAYFELARDEPDKRKQQHLLEQAAAAFKRGHDTAEHKAKRDLLQERCELTEQVLERLKKQLDARPTP